VWGFNLSKKELIETAVLVALVLIAGIVLVFYRPTILAGDTQYKPVYTGSMAPAIGVGSVVLIKPVNPNNLEVGDIICYSFSGTTVTHRIIEVTDEGFITKGDANEDPDQLTVGKENIIGKVVLNLPILGYVGSFARTSLGYILLVVTPVVTLIGFEIKNIIEELKKERNKQNRTPLTPEKQVDARTTIRNVFNAAILKLTSIRALFVIGTLFLVGGAILWFYTPTVIFGLEQALANPNLPLNEVWRYEGSLQWWRSTYIAVVLPAKVILITAGLTLVTCPIFYKKIS
jgi:signal peptidase